MSSLMWNLWAVIMAVGLGVTLKSTLNQSHLIIRLLERQGEQSERENVLANQLRSILKLLQEIFQLITALKPSPAVRAVLTLRDMNGVKVMQLQDNQPGSYALALVDAAGLPAALDPTALPVWSITDPSLANLTPSADGLSCAVVPSGAKLGQAIVQVSIAAANAEPAIQGQDTLTIVGGVAVAATLVGTPGVAPTPPVAAAQVKK